LLISILVLNLLVDSNDILHEFVSLSFIFLVHFDPVPLNYFQILVQSLNIKLQLLILANDHFFHCLQFHRHELFHGYDPLCEAEDLNFQVFNELLVRLIQLIIIIIRPVVIAWGPIPLRLVRTNAIIALFESV